MNHRLTSISSAIVAHSACGAPPVAMTSQHPATSLPPDRPHGAGHGCDSGHLGGADRWRPRTRTGDALTYAWTQTPAVSGRHLQRRSRASPTWTPPGDGGHLLPARRHGLGWQGRHRPPLRDGAGASSRAANQAPVLATGTPSATPSSVTGAVPVQLSVTATDPDGDALTYAWTQEPASPVGSFSSPSVASPTWTSPAVTAPASTSR